MKIIYIIPGSGGTFYCQNCMRDNTLADAMRKAGHNVVIVPMYLPMFSGSECDTQKSPVFFGAVELYLKYRFSWLKNLPAWLSRFLNTEWLLKFAAKQAGATRSAGNEGMTIDILNGQSSIMSDELEKLLQWLLQEEKPDIIHISNALLLGIAKAIKDKLNVPIVCSLQDEHQWIDSMNSPYIEQVWHLIAEKTADVDTFIAVSQYYGEKMQHKLFIPPEKIKVVHIGIATRDYPVRKTLPNPPAIGFISKISATAGFGILVEAFLLLKSEKRFRDLKLYASGGLTRDNFKDIRRWKNMVAKAGWADDFIIEPKFELHDRIKMLSKISLLSVPVPGGEAFGSYLIEAMATGVPVVQPAEGAFPEIVGKTGGGVIYQPNNAEKLAETLAGLLTDKNKMDQLALAAQNAVRSNFDTSNFVNNTLRAYQAAKKIP